LSVFVSCLKFSVRNDLCVAVLVTSVLDKVWSNARRYHVSWDIETQGLPLEDQITDAMFADTMLQYTILSI
jgi:hypothetical protein